MLTKAVGQYQTGIGETFHVSWDVGPAPAMMAQHPHNMYSEQWRIQRAGQGDPEHVVCLYTDKTCIDVNLVPSKIK